MRESLFEEEKMFDDEEVKSPEKVKPQEVGELEYDPLIFEGISEDEFNNLKILDKFRVYLE